jgi:hypothetical protein
MSLDLSDVATELLTELASDTNVKIKRTTGAVFDPVAGTQTGGVTTITDLVAAVTKVDSALIDGERIQYGDKEVLMDNQFQPLMSDTIIIPDDQNNDIEYKIVSPIGGVNHAGIRQTYKVICRG